MHVCRRISSALALAIVLTGSLSFDQAARVSHVSAQSPRATGAEVQGALSRYELDAAEPAQFDLPRNLREISGLGIGDRGRLFAHQDERGRIFELDPKTGTLIKSFRLGADGITGDFEGIALVGPRIFLVSSEGLLFEFREAAGDASAAYQKHELAIRNRCSEIEGLDYDARNNELLLACKITRGAEQRNRLIVFAFSLQTMSMLPAPRLALPLSVLEKLGLDPQLNPSGIAVHPETGTLFIVAAQQNLIVEFARDGRLLGRAKLRRRIHPQPEGIAFAADGTLYVADEGRSGRAALTVYPPNRARAEAGRE